MMGLHPSLSHIDPADLAEVCRRFHVTRLDAFGSVTSDGFDPDRSDVDLLVSFEDIAIGRYAANYFDLRDELTEMFGRPVDLVTAKAVKNPFLIRSISKTRKSLYGHDV